MRTRREKGSEGGSLSAADVYQKESGGEAKRLLGNGCFFKAELNLTREPYRKFPEVIILESKCPKGREKFR